jgi:hypothetical protein
MQQIRTIISVLATMTNLACFCQTNAANDITNKIAHPPFYLYYAFSGLGSNLGSFQPTIKIHDTNFIYTYEQNSYWGEKSNKVDTICLGVLRQSSIDSIRYLIQPLKDSTIFKTNACIMSGGIHFLTVSNGSDTTKFTLGNTFDYTALKIVDIINPYLPAEKKLWPTEKLIKAEEDCWTNMIKRKGNDKRKNNKAKKKNGAALWWHF